MAQWRYTTPETVTRNVTRIIRIDLFPQELNRAVIHYVVGFESGGVFTPIETKHKEVDNLPAPVQTIVTNLETQGLNYLATNALIPPGARE